ncbi:polysaccharide lyase 8 family protein [Paenibacillus sp. HB172176]|uniref:polysaccharide lyase 8 family protein n=1 Tax=Paenibacillus sp. HB172176 TaxID=2493690 RepID=UPI00143BDEA0|nr:polysaccharide lyase 8 family protein [Paenibacillus sp. HB172176]
MKAKKAMKATKAMKAWKASLSILIIASAFLSLLTVKPTAAHASDEYDSLRGRIFDDLSGGTGFDPDDPDIEPRIDGITASAQSLWSTMDTSSSRTYLWSDLGDALGPSMHSTHVSGSYSRLLAMAVAYSTVGSTLYHNASLLTDIIEGMDWMYDNRYNTSVPVRGYDNWYDWQISAPLSINRISVLLYDHLTAQQISDWHAVIDYQALSLSSSSNKGANRVWTCYIVITSGIVTKDSSKITAGVSGLSPVLDYVASGEGIYRDGSFLQHTALIAYNGGYGISMLNNLTQVMYIVAGSSWDITDPDLGNVYQWIYDAYEPLFVSDGMMAMVQGRNIARIVNDSLNPASTGSSMGALGSAVVRLSASAPDPSDAARYKSMVKQWMNEATSQTPYASLDSIQIINLTKAIMGDSGVSPRGDLSLDKQYPSMAKAVHRTDDFAFGVSMTSKKVSNYESINGENLKGWHTGDGMTYLYMTDPAAYSDAYWPTVDSHRLPGTTVIQGSEPDPHLKNGSSWVGGTEASGRYGVSGMQLQPANSSLNAYKSWFMFDDEIVNLGAGISSGSGVVETIVDNRKLNSSGSNALTVNGSAKSSALGWNETMSSVNWAHIAGSVAGSDVGYYFPGQPTVKALREARTANWYSINNYFDNSSLNPEYYQDFTRNYLTMWLDHGSSPSGGSYSYVTLPNKSTSEVADYAANPDIVILENSTAAQAVREVNLGVTGINFWQNAVETVAGVTSNKKASVMLRNSVNGLEVSVSDPTMENTGTIQLTLDWNAGPLAYKDANVSVAYSGNQTVLTFNAANTLGESLKVWFNHPGSPDGGTAVDEEFDEMSEGILNGQGGWSSDTGGVSVNSVKVAASASTNGNAVKLTTQSASGKAEASRLFSAPSGSIITAEATVTADDNNWKNAVIVADSSLSSNNKAAHLVMQNGKIWGYNGGTKTDILTSATNGTPYHLKAVINTATKKFDVYVDGTLRASQWDYRDSGASDLDLFVTGIAGNASSMSIDDVSITYLPMAATTLIDESFNGMTNGNLDGQSGWRASTGGVSANSVNVEASPGGKAVKLTTQTTSGSAEASKSFSVPSGSLLIAETTVTADDNNWKNALMVLDSSLSSNNKAVHLVLQNGRIWGYNGGTKTDILTSTANGTPYRLKAVINTATKKFDIYVNDELRASGWDYRNAGASTLDLFSSGIAGNASSMSLDDVRVAYFQ